MILYIINIDFKYKDKIIFHYNSYIILINLKKHIYNMNIIIYKFEMILIKAINLKLKFIKKSFKKIKDRKKVKNISYSYKIIKK